MYRYSAFGCQIWIELRYCSGLHRNLLIQCYSNLVNVERGSCVTAKYIQHWNLYNNIFYYSFALSFVRLNTIYKFNNSSSKVVTQIMSSKMTSFYEVCIGSFYSLLLLLLLNKVGSARLREGDIHPISPKTSAPRYQPIDRKKRKGNRAA